MRVRTYVAMGDSFTAGNGCPAGHRWADLLADSLGGGEPDFRYLNLARDGADSRQVMEQIPAAIASAPDLVTLICGANDVLLTPRPDIAGFAGRLDAMIRRLRHSSPEVRILTATYPVGWELPGIGPRTKSRIDRGMTRLNRVILELSADRSIPCLDVTDHPGISEPLNFESDGLHPSEVGHRRAAAEIGRAIESSFRPRPEERSTACM